MSERKHVGLDYWCSCGAIVRGGWSCHLDGCKATKREADRRKTPVEDQEGAAEAVGRKWNERKRGAPNRRSA